MRRPALKDIHLEQSIFGFRILLLAIFTLALMGGLLYNLVQLQVVQHERYADLAQNNRVRLSPVVPGRGLIYDRNGVLIADNIPSYSLEVVPEEVDDLPNMLSLLGSLVELTDDDLAAFDKARRRTPSFRAVPLKLSLTEEEVARFYVEQYRFPGVNVEVRLNRYYPQGELFSHVLGYVGRINDADLQRLDKENYQGSTHTGKGGVERFYEDVLHGQAGWREDEVNSRGRPIREISMQNAVSGKSLMLSVDIKLQQAVIDILGDRAGSVVALDPRNGEILAMVSNPGFDPNLFVNGISTKEYSKLRDNQKRPLFNRSIQGQYPPGSTVKPVVALAGLENKLISPHAKMFANGYFQLPDDPHRYRDWKRSGHGWVDMYSAIAVSSDVYFYDLSYKLGIDGLSDMFRRFGLGTETGVDLPNESSGLLPTREWKRARYNKPWFPGETLIVGIGQGYMLATPLQLSKMVACIAMAGDCAQPHLLKEMVVGDGKALETGRANISEIQIINKRDWKEIGDAMVGVMSGPLGTAKAAAQGAPYVMAGKTGTSQVFGLKQDEEYDEEKLSEKLRDHSLFVGYAPADDPKIAVAVIVEHGGSGSRVAAPIARQVMDAWLLRPPRAPVAEGEAAVQSGAPVESPGASR